MKIAFVCSEYPPGPHGGIGTVTQVLSRGLAHAGHEVRVIGAYPEWYAGAGYEVDEGVRVWRTRIASYRGSWLTARYGMFRMLAQWAKRDEIDLVEVPDWGGWAAGWPSLPVPVVARMHGSSTYFTKELGGKPSALTFRIERASLKRADFLCAVSAYTGDFTKTIFGLTSSSVHVIYNPVETRPHVADFAGRTPGNVVFTGALVPKKGIVPLIDAWSEVRRSVPHAQLHLFGKDGPGPEGGRMSEFLIKRLPETDRQSLFFHGHVTREELFEVLSVARAAVFPSFSETFGMGPVEAMMCGCPTVYTRLSCGPEIVRDEVDGLLINPHEPSTISRAFVRLLCDTATAKSLGERGRERAVGAFALEKVLGENERYYERCIQEFHGST